jgi:prepilin-type N-terminal cleavage/methylation domain-containing protein
MTLQRGFSLIELMITVAIIGVLAASAIPAFIKYTRKAKTAEARQNVKKIADGARQFYMDQRYASVTDMQPLPAEFPGAIGMGHRAPPVTYDCCAVNNASTEEKCAPNAFWWEQAIWPALHFSMSDAHYYGYEYGRYAPGPPFTDLFSTQAVGDLDCDDRHAYFNMTGFVNPAVAEGPLSTNVMRRLDELE